MSRAGAANHTPLRSLFTLQLDRQATKGQARRKVFFSLTLSSRHMRSTMDLRLTLSQCLYISI